MDDRILISSIKGSPKEGLLEALHVYGPFVKAVTVKILGTSKPRDVEECIADTFVKLWQSIDAYDEERGSLKSYVLGIARNTAIDRYRKNHPKVKLQSISEVDGASSQDIEEDVLRNIDREIVRDTIDSLPEPDRDIFYRRYFLFEKVNDIALHLGLNKKYVEKRLYKGKRRLREKLIDKGINL